MNKEITLSIRVDQKNPLHHLWNNNGTWWLHCTVQYVNHTTKRIRKSLKTHDQVKAQTLRDNIFRSLGMEVSV